MRSNTTIAAGDEVREDGLDPRFDPGADSAVRTSDSIVDEPSPAFFVLLLVFTTTVFSHSPNDAEVVARVVDDGSVGGLTSDGVSVGCSEEDSGLTPCTILASVKRSFTLLDNAFLISEHLEPIWRFREQYLQVGTWFRYRMYAVSFSILMYDGIALLSRMRTIRTPFGIPGKKSCHSSFLTDRTTPYDAKCLAIIEFGMCGGISCTFTSVPPSAMYRGIATSPFSDAMKNFLLFSATCCSTKADDSSSR